MRLDTLWRDSHAHSRAGNFKLWNLDLDCIWAELARDLKQKTKEDKENFNNTEIEFNEFDKNLEELGQISDSVPMGFKSLTPEQIKARTEHYKILRKKQIFLARLENRLGKGTTFDDDDEDDM